MSEQATLDRIDAALLDHATSEAQAWVWERIDEDVAKAANRQRSGDVYCWRPMIELRTANWQISEHHDWRSWTVSGWEPGGTYVYKHARDADPLSTYAHLDAWGMPREAAP